MREEFPKVEKVADFDPAKDYQMERDYVLNMAENLKLSRSEIDDIKKLLSQRADLANALRYYEGPRENKKEALARFTELQLEVGDLIRKDNKSPAAGLLQNFLNKQYDFIREMYPVSAETSF